MERTSEMKAVDRLFSFPSKWTWQQSLLLR